jgi:hypothetical protein
MGVPPVRLLRSALMAGLLSSKPILAETIDLAEKLLAMGELPEDEPDEPNQAPASKGVIVTIPSTLTRALPALRKK